MIVTVGGKRCQRAALHIMQSGPWYCDAWLDESPETPLTGRVTVAVAGVEFSGTVIPQYSGNFSAARKLRVVAGAAGWGTLVGPKSYHNDLGVKGQTVARDAATEVGETLGTWSPARQRLGPDFVRRGGSASSALEQTLDGVPWWVDQQGVTHAGPRPAVACDPAGYEILGYDPTTRMATLSVHSPLAIQIGSTIRDRDRLDVDLVVREIEYRVTPESARAVCWVGGDEMSDCRLPRALRAIVNHLIDQRLYGVYSYEIEVPGDRLTLRSRARNDRLPERLVSVVQAVGVPGVSGQWQVGQEVLVAFLDGQPDAPRVVGFAPGTASTSVAIAAQAGISLESQTTAAVKGGSGLTLETDAIAEVKAQMAKISAQMVQLGGDGGLPVARVGDTVQVVDPISGTLTGVITAGSTKVMAA